MGYGTMSFLIVMRHGNPPSKARRVAHPQPLGDIAGAGVGAGKGMVGPNCCTIVSTSDPKPLGLYHPQQNHGWGVRVSRVDFKNWPCPLSLLKTPCR